MILQPVTKWVTRFDLGLSDTVPALAFKGRDIDMFTIDDEGTLRSFHSFIHV